MERHLAGITALLFDTDGVLFHRPRRNRNLATFLAQHGLEPRDPAFEARALRAARFDVMTGRIRRDDYFDAVLRVHGIFDEALLPEGREALLRDAADIELFPGVCETLNALYGAGYRLGAVADAACYAGEHIAWMAVHRVSPGVWSAFVLSPDVGATTAEPAIFECALQQVDAEPPRVAYVGHETAALASASQLGLVTVAFLPDDPLYETDLAIGSFYELGERLLGAI